MEIERSLFEEKDHFFYSTTPRIILLKIFGEFLATPIRAT